MLGFCGCKLRSDTGTNHFDPLLQLGPTTEALMERVRLKSCMKGEPIIESEASKLRGKEVVQD